MKKSSVITLHDFLELNIGSRYTTDEDKSYRKLRQAYCTTFVLRCAQRRNREKRAPTSAGHISKVLQREREEELVGEGNLKALRRLAKVLLKDRQLSIVVDIQRDIIFLNSCNAMDLDDGEVRDAMPRIVECCKKSGTFTPNKGDFITTV
jgi:hypothetical protein